MEVVVKGVGASLIEYDGHALTFQEGFFGDAIVALVMVMHAKGHQTKLVVIISDGKFVAQPAVDIDAAEFAVGNSDKVLRRGALAADWVVLAQGMVCESGDAEGADDSKDNRQYNKDNYP
jgi:hypothetical protein